jgi:hypothetical protein
MTYLGEVCGAGLDNQEISGFEIGGSGVGLEVRHPMATA